MSLGTAIGALGGSIFLVSLMDAPWWVIGMAIGYCLFRLGSEMIKESADEKKGTL